MKMDEKAKKYLRIIGILMFIAGVANFTAMYFGFTTLSVSSSSSNGLSFTIHSSNPNNGLLLSSVMPELVSGYTYNWSMTIQNTGALPFYGHGTIRIAGPSASYVTEPGSSAYLGADGGTGVVQECGGVVNSTGCLVNLEDWQLSVSGSNAVSSFAPSGDFAAISLPNELQPGASETVYFTIKPPTGTASGQYLALFNFVGNSGGVAQVIGYQAVPIDVGNVAATVSVEELGSIASAALGIALLALAFL